MTTPKMVRCRKCSYCLYDKSDKLVCSECGNKPIEDVEDGDCPVENDY